MIKHECLRNFRAAPKRNTVPVKTSSADDFLKISLSLCVTLFCFILNET